MLSSVKQLMQVTHWHFPLKSFCQDLIIKHGGLLLHTEINFNENFYRVLSQPSLHNLLDKFDKCVQLLYSRFLNWFYFCQEPPSRFLNVTWAKLT